MEHINGCTAHHDSTLTLKSVFWLAEACPLVVFTRMFMETIFLDFLCVWKDFSLVLILHSGIAGHKIWWCSFPLKLCRHHCTVASIVCGSGEVWIQTYCFSSLNIRLFFLPLLQAHRSVLIWLHPITFLKKNLWSISKHQFFLSSRHALLSIVRISPIIPGKLPLNVLVKILSFYWILVLHLLMFQGFSHFPANPFKLFFLLNFAHFLSDVCYLWWCF